MAQVDRVELVISSTDGRFARFSLGCLPGHRYMGGPPLWDDTKILPHDPSLEAIQILEGEEYRFVVEATGVAKITNNKPEVIDADSDSGASGRLRPGLHTGVLPIQFYGDGQFLGEVRFEVRSRKLDYLHDYQWMLRDIAQLVAEIVSQHFAPSEQRFIPDSTRDPVSLYQQFAFIFAFITGTEFETALAQIIARPKVTWGDEEQLRPPTMGVRGGSRLLKSLIAPGQRQPWPNSPFPDLDTLPVTLSVSHREESVDNPENRFVRFALNHWRGLIYDVRQKLEAAEKTDAVQRGVRETEEALGILDVALSEEVFRELGELAAIPSASTVLTQREGYREIYHAYLQSEVAAQLTWGGGDSVYGAGQRNVAQLYEFWAFLELVRVVDELCNQTPMNLAELIEKTDDGLGLRLQQGKQLVLSGAVNRLNRQISIGFYYNRTFSARSSFLEDGAWTRPMRPDYSLRLSVQPQLPTPTEDSVWLHFDAKYRVEELASLFGRNPSTDAEEQQFVEADREAKSTGRYKRADLLRMHAYRDAVKRTRGAYILYPGTAGEEKMSRYQEILPGIGAFPLRPSSSGTPDGTSAIRSFLNDVLQHLAIQSTQHERARFWERVVFESDPQVPAAMRANAFLTRPPADTRVLLVWIASPDHYKWIVNNRLLLLPRRAIARRPSLEANELNVDFILLYSDLLVLSLWRMTGRALLLTTEEATRLGFPGSVSQVALALPLGEGPFTLTDNVSTNHLASLRLSRGSKTKAAPVVVSFLELAST